MKESEIIEFINNWFEINPIENKQFWLTNPLARIIRIKLKELGRWKDFPRGNPAEGYKIMLKKKNEFEF